MKKNKTLTINSNPMKSLFVDMFRRDISVKMAFLDFIDNSLDGSKRNKIQQATTIKIKFDGSTLEIIDNSGGIGIDNATNYAFGFGVVSPFNAKNSLGRFGIGMKRGIIKIGNTFRIESGNEDYFFKIDCNLNEWLKDLNWNFLMHHQAFPKDIFIGTKISITDFTEQAKRQFNEPIFWLDLIELIDKTYDYQASLGNGRAALDVDFEFSGSAKRMPTKIKQARLKIIEEQEKLNQE